MMFVELDDNGNILASASFRFSESCVETNVEIVRSKDGKLFFLGEEPQVDKLEDRKKEIIFERQQKLENVFYSEYPLYKQCNIGIYGTAEEKLAFKNFHDSKVAIYHIFTDAVEECTNLNELDELCSSLNEE
ncbi:MAG: hypothetical protein LBB21_03085 [Holosporaceae bacterium]|nr:hypothetical protein [Holosporaceae bacterium]